MFRLKELEILGSKAELAALPEGKLLINTINAHSYNTARKDKLFAEALTNGDVLIPDGVSIVKACKWIKAKSQPKERIAGWDLFSFEMGKLERESEERRVKSEESSADNDNQVEGKSKIDNSSSASADNSCLGKRLYEPSAKLKIQNSKFELSSPEARGDVFKLAISRLTVEALVGGAVFQSAEMTDVRANLDVVELFLVHISRHLCATSVPSHFIIRIMLVNVFGNLAHTIVLRIAAHKTDACYVATVTLHEPVDGVHGERFTNVIPQILAVTTGTTTRTIGDVDGKGHLVRNLLKDDVGIYIFKHYFLILPLF